MEVDVAALDFGEDQETLSFSVTVSGGETDWKLEGDLPAWCKAKVERSASGGRVTIKADRGSLSPGEYTASLAVRWESGSHTVNIRMVVPAVGKDAGTIIIDIPLPEDEEE